VVVTGPSGGADSPTTTSIDLGASVPACRPETLGFTATAPLRATATREVPAWEPGERFAFTFTGTNLPAARAGVELVELVEPGPDRTRVAYTFAVEPAGIPRALAASSAPIVRAVLSRGLAGLERHLT
jgi:hypothetical protein